MVPMVWVIDDDASIRFVFDRGLALQHISHRLFDSGEEALAALAREVPDVIVSDIRMPGISGLDLIARVRAVDDAIPFIIITAHSDLNESEMMMNTIKSESTMLTVWLSTTIFVMVYSISPLPVASSV